MTTYKHTRNNIPELLGQIKELRDDGDRFFQQIQSLTQQVRTGLLPLSDDLRAIWLFCWKRASVTGFFSFPIWNRCRNWRPPSEAELQREISDHRLAPDRRLVWNNPPIHRAENSVGRVSSSSEVRHQRSPLCRGAAASCSATIGPWSPTITGSIRTDRDRRRPSASFATPRRVRRSSLRRRRPLSQTGLLLENDRVRDSLNSARTWFFVSSAKEL